MKCEIIRDLFPSYLDGLTSEESNRAIEGHLEDCAPCGEILRQMRQDMEEKPQEIEKQAEKRKINLFRKFNRRMKSAVAGAVAICIYAGGVGYKAFGQGFAIDPGDIRMDVRVDDEMLYLDFAVEDGNLMHYGTMCDENSAEIKLRKVLALPGDDLGEHPNEFSWGMSLNALTIGGDAPLEVAMADGSLTILEAGQDGQELTIKKADKDEEMEMTLQTGGSEDVEMMITDADESGNGVGIRNPADSPLTMMMFQEGNEATSMMIGNQDKVDWNDYTIQVELGKETVSYSVAELMEMAER